MKTQYCLDIKTDYLKGNRDVAVEAGKCNNFDERKNEGTPIWIMQHHTASDHKRSIWHFTKGKVSPHYLIAQDGVVQHFVLDHDRAYHAGVGTFNYGSGLNEHVKQEILENDMNSWSLGIENVNNGFTPFTGKQTIANIHLLELLVTKHKIDPKLIVGHGDWTIGRKCDPSPYFPWEKLAAASKLEGIDHDFGVYSFLETRNTPDVVATYGKASRPDIIVDIQDKLRELGYPAPASCDKEYGTFSQSTVDAILAFSIHYMNQTITSDPTKLEAWNIRCGKENHEIVTPEDILLSQWTENHNVVIGEVLDLFGK